MMEEKIRMAIEAWGKEAELLGINGSSITVQFLVQDFTGFRELLEKETGMDVTVENVERTEKGPLVTLSISEKGKGPADEILDVLRKYDEGSPPKTFGFED